MSSDVEFSYHIPQRPRIETDTLPYGYIGELQQRFTTKIYNPADSETATEYLLAKRELWRQTGAITVFASGVFDMLHADHAGYLLHTKAAGAALLYERTASHADWNDLDTQQQQAFTSQALSDRAIRLVVSVDGDSSVAARKGFKTDKSGGPRPIYAWQTRALSVAGQTFIDPEDAEQERLLPTADAVTIHGPEDFPTGHIHQSHLSLVEALQPDAWVFFGESTDVAEAAPRNQALGSIALRRIQGGQGTHYYEDAFMGKMSTTKIVRRILGTDS